MDSKKDKKLSASELRERADSYKDPIYRDGWCIHGMRGTRTQIRYAHEFLYTYYNTYANVGRQRVEAAYSSPVEVLLQYEFGCLYWDYGEYMELMVPDDQERARCKMSYDAFLNWACLEYMMIPKYYVYYKDDPKYAFPVPHMECILVMRELDAPPS